MGLVTQPLDALLSFAGMPALAAAPTAGIVVDGVFAALVASLSATVEGDATSLTVDPPILDGAMTEAPKEKDEPATDALATLFAVALPLHLAPTLMPTEADQPSEPASDAAGAPSPVATSPVIETALSASTWDSVLDVPTRVAPAEADGRVQALGTVAPNPIAEGPDAAQAMPATTFLSPSSVPANHPSQTPAVTTQAALPNSPLPVDSVSMARAKEGPPPSEAETASTEQHSVVRSVGNAETQNSEAETGDSQNGRKDIIDRPQPRASAQGIAHAAPNSAVGQLRETTVETMPTAPEAPASAEVPPQVEQVATTVIEQVEAGGGEARIHLDPVDLGEVTIHVRTEGDTVRVEVRAERQEAMQLLRDHTQELSSLLGERGLNLSDVNVALGRGNGNGAWGEDARPENRPQSGEFASILGLDDETPIELHQRLRAAYNPDGAHLYRV